MLARKFKIDSRERIECILKKGRNFKAGLLRFKFLPSNKAHSRFAVIATKAAFRRAVDRNRVRRRVYEAIRLHFHKFGKPCYDVVVLMSQRAAKAPFQNIEEDIYYLVSSSLLRAHSASLYHASKS